MKKFMKLMVAFALVLAMGLSMVACGGSDGESSSESSASKETTASKSESTSVTGAWELSLLIDDKDNEYTLEEYCEEQGVDAKGMEMVYDFKDDGTMTATMGGVEATGTYTFEDGVLTMTMDSDGQASELNYDEEADELYITDEASGMTSVITRQ